MAAYQIADIKASLADVINWKVGDYQKSKSLWFSVAALATKKPPKTKPDQHAVWLTENMSILGQTQKSEVLISRVDGSVLKMIVNGKEQPADDQKSKFSSKAKPPYRSCRHF